MNIALFYLSNRVGVSRAKNVLLAANAAGAVQHWHMSSGKCLHSYEDADNQVYALDYNSDGSLFVTGGKDTIIRIYDESTKKEIQSMKGKYILLVYIMICEMGVVKLFLIYL